jgi:hypothetical protein
MRTKTSRCHPRKSCQTRRSRFLEKWIKMGAPWPEDAANKVVVTEGGFTEEQRNYWFFQPVKKGLAAACGREVGAQ